MNYPLINGAPINGTDSTDSWSVGNIVETGTAASALRATAAGDQPWVFGQFRVQSGTDVEFSPFGVSLVRSGLHSAIAAQPPATVDVQAAGARPMVLGDLTAVLAPITVDAGGAIRRRCLRLIVIPPLAHILGPLRREDAALFGACQALLAR